MRSWSQEGGSVITDLVPKKRDDLGELDDPKRLGIKAALERVRQYIRTTIPPREQWKILQTIDTVQEHLMKPQFDLEAVQRDLQSSKGTTRRSLHQKPALVGQMLACLEGLEQEIIDFINEALKGSKSK